MMKRLLTMLALLCFAQAAHAQSWGGGPGQQPVVFPVSGTTYTGQIGDGTTSQGGIPPAEALEPADIGDVAAGYTLSQWMPTTGISRVINSEAKVRFECNASHAAQEDPILFHGQAKTGHWHEFVGNSAAGKDSTYAQLRMNGKGTCPGGPANRTAYWHPAMMKDLATGVTGIIRADKEIFYYTHNIARSPRKTRIINNMAFIGGVDPADPTNAAKLAEVPSGWRIPNTYGPNGNGFVGWYCMLSNGSLVNTVNGNANAYPGIQTPTGTDPWLGNCVAGSTLYAEIFAPMCWDGKNPTSPDGRSHVRYPIHPIAAQTDEFCPTGWWQIPTFVAKTQYTVGTGGWLDYKEWYLSSDRHGLTQANWRTPGSTFHFDWMNGWDPVAIDSWLVDCTGVTIGATPGNPGACDSATIGTAKRLLSNGEPSPDTNLSNNPVVNLGLTHWNDGKDRFYPVRPGTTGDGHLRHGVIPVIP